MNVSGEGNRCGVKGEGEDGLAVGEACLLVCEICGGELDHRMGE